MGIPQVPEQVRRAPTLALRAVFAGVGRILMSADRPETAIATPDRGTEGDIDHRQPDQRRQRSVSSPPAEPSSRWRSLDQTGNVRLLSAEDLDDDDFRPAAAPAGIADATAATLPLAGYDSLSLASIRARLRGLDVVQLRVLLDYEATNAERPEVLGMFERRIAKLESAQ
jgi:hypothetical protein